ncbi:hypothetical protein GCM10023148_43650 [Actinokineospora soli]
MLLTAGCFSITDGPDRMPDDAPPLDHATSEAAATTRPGEPTRPAEPEPIRPAGVVDDARSTPRSTQLKDLLVAYAKETGLDVVDARDLESGDATLAGVLVRGGGGYGAISSVITDPVITSGEAACTPKVDHCSVRPMDGGTAVVLDAATVWVDWHLPDLRIPFYVHADDEVDRDGALFWHGGARAPRPPLSADQATALAQRVHTAFPVR